MINIKNNNRGAALIYVIITAAVIVLLGAATTAAAFVNLKATQLQERSNTNFYSADSVMNAILSGLESDVSIAYENAYTTAITSLNDGSISDEQKKTQFETNFKNGLAFLVRDKVYGYYYDIARIQSYAEGTKSNDIRYTISALNGNGYVDTLNDGIMLRNLHVTYENDNGYFDEITTDVKITVPEIDMTAIGKEKPRFNAFIFSNGLEIEKTKGLQINGNAYINTRADDETALSLGDATSVSFVSPKETIIGGKIKTDENTLLLIKSGSGSTKDNAIWTENIKLGRYSNVNISGILNVWDDLEINGSHSKVVLSGEYYGFGDEKTSHNKSSAIIVNGAKTKLDIQKLDALILAGTSYLKSSEIETSDENRKTNLDIVQGESIAIKSNQIAYLVDDKEFNDDDKVYSFVSNPMTYAQYDEFLRATGGNNKTPSERLKTVIMKLTTKKLSYGGKSYQEYGATIVPIFKAKESADDPGSVYLYLQFNGENREKNAADYFNAVYSSNTLMSQRLRTYAAQYIDSLILNDNASLIVNNNFLDTDGKEYTKESLTESVIGSFYKRSSPTKDSIENITTMLKAKYLGNGNEEGKGKKYEVMYKKIIVDNDKLQQFIDDAKIASTDKNTNNKITKIDNGVCLQGSSKAKAYIVNNEGKEIFETPSGSGIIIASGDVNIKEDWTGTIIANGHVVCVNGTKTSPITITVDDSVINSVISLYYVKKLQNNDVKKIAVINLIKGYETYEVKGSTKSADINADIISKCITFTNWNKH